MPLGAVAGAHLPSEPIAVSIVRPRSASASHPWAMIASFSNVGIRLDPEGRTGPPSQDDHNYYLRGIPGLPMTGSDDALLRVITGLPAFPERADANAQEKLRWLQEAYERIAPVAGVRSERIVHHAPVHPDPNPMSAGSVTVTPKGPVLSIKDAELTGPRSPDHFRALALAFALVQAEVHKEMLLRSHWNPYTWAQRNPSRTGLYDKRFINDVTDVAPLEGAPNLRTRNVMQRLALQRSTAGVEPAGVPAVAERESL